MLYYIIFYRPPKKIEKSDWLKRVQYISYCTGQYEATKALEKRWRGDVKFPARISNERISNIFQFERSNVYSVRKIKVKKMLVAPGNVNNSTK